VAMQFYASPEQIMRDRSEYARKNIARGRGVVVLTYSGGVLFVAETVSTTLHKVSEIYDRIGFAAVGRYNEFENLRAAGVRMADLRGYSYDRRDVTGRALANAYAQTLGAIFGEQGKPFEVELCVAEVGSSPDHDEMYRLTYDGSVQDEPGLMAMGGQAEAIATAVRAGHRPDMSLPEALRLAVNALAGAAESSGVPRNSNQLLEVAILDRSRTGRTFRRLVGPVLQGLLDQTKTRAAGTDTAPSDGDGTAAAETATGTAPENGEAASGDAASPGSTTPAPTEPEAGPAGTADKPGPAQSPDE
jgi:proteasome alpha subunit